MKKLSLALLFSVSLGAAPALFADQNDNVLHYSSNLSQTTSSAENLQLAEWGWWSRDVSYRDWCYNHPRECHRNWCENHHGACGSTWCERHPRQCREEWCERHPRDCY